MVGDESTEVGPVRPLLEMSYNDAREFLFDPSSYCDLDLPKYFDFTPVLKCAKAMAEPNNSHRKGSENVGHLSNVNHLILDNKDGAYAWRSMQLVHPFLYAELVYLITDPANWEVLQNRFIEFQANERIVCTSMPLVNYAAPNKATAVRSWWLKFEQESVRLSLDYKYLATTDIADCYGSLYTHSIAWAVHGRSWAKVNRKTGLGNKLDNLFQDLHERQTNGIPQGNAVSDLVAEIVLGYADLKLSERLQDQLEDYQILRYRDDYRVFSNSKEDAQRILLELTRVLRELNFKLSSTKTRLSDDVIGASVKPDKQYVNQTLNSRRNAFKNLLLIRELGQRFPNSGSLVTSLSRFRKVIERRNERPRDNPVLIAVVADIMHRNPRTYPHAASVLSKLFSFEEPADVERYLERIRKKFRDVPNTGFLDIWMQRISLGYNFKPDYNESLCKAVYGDSTTIWNSDWLVNAAKHSLDTVSKVNQDVLRDMGGIISIEETELFIHRYDDEDDGVVSVDGHGINDFF